MLGDPMELNQPLYSKCPESFNPDDVDFSLFELVPVIDILMLIPTEQQ